MRPRFRTEPGPNATREGRPLELVRVRGTQRDTGHDSRELNKRRRRRGGRRRSGGSRPPAPPQPAAPKFSLPRWLASIFTRRPASLSPALSISEQEARVLAEFSKHYSLQFNDQSLLKLALTHRSYLSVTGGSADESNERLEFLGDSVLGLVTSENLFRTRPSEHEGQLTKTKSLLVSKAILSRRALAMGLGRFVLMSHSEIESGGRQRLSILADAFESVIGAVYLDLGFEAARGFIDRWLLKEAGEIVADKRHVNYKSHLQEYVQSTFRTHPVYRIRSEMGPDHSKHFMVEVAAGRRVLGEGRGKNKKEAEQAAARQALDRVSDSRSRDTAGRDRNEPRDRQGPRERNEQRDRPRQEPRDREPARDDTAELAPATGVAPGTGEAAETAEAEGLRRGRRRGRRGGRGRRRPEGMTPGVEPRAMGAVETPVKENGEPPAAVAPPRPFTPRPLAQRPLPPRNPAREVRAERPREVEPLPPARLEDEIEEVGRPEGPMGESFVEPFVAEEKPRRRPEWESGPAAPARQDEESEAHDEGETSPAMESGSRRRPAGAESGPEGPAGAATKPAEPGERRGDDARAGYGRRPGRGRR